MNATRQPPHRPIASLAVAVPGVRTSVEGARRPPAQDTARSAGANAELPALIRRVQSYLDVGRT
jgi:hypothetical protein